MGECTINSLAARVSALEVENASLRLQIATLELERKTLQETIWEQALTSAPPPLPPTE